MSHYAIELFELFINKLYEEGIIVITYTPKGDDGVFTLLGGYILEVHKDGTFIFNGPEHIQIKIKSLVG